MKSNIPVLRDNQFNRKGLVKTKKGLLVPAYIGSGLGFNYPGQFFLNDFYSRLQGEAGVLPLCPFESCGSFLDLSELNDSMSLREAREFWGYFGTKIVGPVNYRGLMPKSKMMIALLEGQTVDEGLAAEIPEFLHTNKGPLVGIRSDFRLAENMSAPINLAIAHFFHNIHENPFRFRTYFVQGPAKRETYDAAISLIRDIADAIRKR